MKRNKISRHNSITNWVITLMAAVLTFGLLVAADNMHVPKKWVTAIMGSLGSFSFVIYAYRRQLFQWSFWASLFVCLTAHTAVVWVFFQYVLNDIQTFSIWLWLPVMFIEAFVLLVAVKKIEERFLGQPKAIKPDF